MSGGCDRCAKYGSWAQRYRAAIHIARAINQYAEHFRPSEAQGGKEGSSKVHREHPNESESSSPSVSELPEIRK
jgi:hypothetical protein